MGKKLSTRWTDGRYILHTLSLLSIPRMDIMYFGPASTRSTIELDKNRRRRAYWLQARTATCLPSQARG